MLYAIIILGENSFLLYHVYLENLCILVTNLTPPPPNLCLSPRGFY